MDEMLLLLDDGPVEDLIRLARQAFDDPDDGIYMTDLRGWVSDKMKTRGLDLEALLQAGR
jgi:hypothetical protein